MIKFLGFIEEASFEGGLEEVMVRGLIFWDVIQFKRKLYKEWLGVSAEKIDWQRFKLICLLGLIRRK